MFLILLAIDLEIWLKMYFTVYGKNYQNVLHLKDC